MKVRYNGKTYTYDEWRQEIARKAEDGKNGAAIAYIIVKQNFLIGLRIIVTYMVRSILFSQLNRMTLPINVRIMCKKKGNVGLSN